jgi:hypothetical protein
MYTSADQNLQTSRTYDFQTNFTFEKIVDMAYARIGRSPNKITDDDVEFARYAANLELREWQARQTTLSLIQREFVEFIPGQIFYKVPDYVYRPLTWVRTITNRMLGGSAFSSDAGDPNPCFDPTSTTGLTQTDPNGYIGYTYPIPDSGPIGETVWYVGILTLTPQIYSINIEYSLDGVNWLIQKSCPQETYYPQMTRWWVCEWPPIARYWRIRETRGATLAIEQIYFCSDQQDLAIGKILRDSYMNFPTKYLPQSAPTTVYYNEKISRNIYVYGNNYNGFNGLTYTAKVFCQDIDQLFQVVDLDAKWYKALVAGISYQLALINNPPNFNILKADYDQSYANMAQDDGEDGPVTISVDLSSSWMNV